MRGLRKTDCGQEVLLQLPREGPLIPGEVLIGSEECPKIQVKVKAAEEELIQVKAKSYLDLCKAAYHLGNRHVDVELQENELYLLKDLVLQDLLEKRNLKIEIVRKSFHPEPGAYSENHKD